jgi:undecaprenyl-diphosphatase
MLAQLARRIWQRHRWSVPLTLCSALFFARLAREVSEHELGPFDAAVQHVVDGWRGSVDTLMVLLTSGGSMPPMTLLTVTVLFLLLAAKRRREVRHLLVSTLGCLLLNVLLKALFQRARPDAEPPYLLPRPKSFAFPSGHTMGSAGVIGSLVVIVRALRPPRLVWIGAIVLGGALILGVALSRVYLGAHYPSDVLGGLFAALAWLSAVTGWVYPRLLPHERSAPLPHVKN